MNGASDRGRDRRPGAHPDPERVVVLQLQQVAYQAALASAGRVVTPSMREFLR